MIFCVPGRWIGLDPGSSDPNPNSATQQAPKLKGVCWGGVIGRKKNKTKTKTEKGREVVPIRPLAFLLFFLPIPPAPLPFYKPRLETPSGAHSPSLHLEEYMGTGELL